MLLSNNFFEFNSGNFYSCEIKNYDSFFIQKYSSLSSICLLFFSIFGIFYYKNINFISFTQFVITFLYSIFSFYYHIFQSQFSFLLVNIFISIFILNFSYNINKFYYQSKYDKYYNIIMLREYLIKFLSHILIIILSVKLHTILIIKEIYEIRKSFFNGSNSFSSRFNLIYTKSQLDKIYYNINKITYLIVTIFILFFMDSFFCNNTTGYRFLINFIFIIILILLNKNINKTKNYLPFYNE